MKLHRFYISDINLKQNLLRVDDKNLLRQWQKVLRLKQGDQLILFDGKSANNLYEIVNINRAFVDLKLIRDIEDKRADKSLYLFWSLLKKDNNELIIQKCTELGVTNFVPIISQRAIRKNFNIDRAQKIIIESSEQCGRSDLPQIVEPIGLTDAIDKYKNTLHLYFCDEKSETGKIKSDKSAKQAGVFIGPEGGWSDEEKYLFTSSGLEGLYLHKFTLRAETAAFAAVTKLCG